MKVEVGDKLDIELKLNGTTWVQTMTNRSNGKTVKFDKDLKGQKQQWLIHEIELKSSVKPIDDVVFTNNVFTLSESQPKACVASTRGATDYVAPARVSADGKTCCISKIILRASGIKATSPDAP